MSFVEQGHLGGYIEGGDDATWYPDLWDWLCEQPREGQWRVLDIGCGEGHSLKYFRDVLSCVVVGTDGVEQDDPDIHVVDYTKGTSGILPYEPAFDIGWCCEVVEHIEERYLPNLLEDFARCDTVLLTHAEPGQQGYHHVNLQTADYWKGALAAIGYRYDPELTEITRLRATANPNPWNHYKRSGLAFVRAS